MPGLFPRERSKKCVRPRPFPFPLPSPPSCVFPVACSPAMPQLLFLAAWPSSRHPVLSWLARFSSSVSVSRSFVPWLALALGLRSALSLPPLRLPCSPRSFSLPPTQAAKPKRRTMSPRYTSVPLAHCTVPSRARICGLYASAPVPNDPPGDPTQRVRVLDTSWDLSHPGRPVQIVKVLAHNCRLPYWTRRDQVTNITAIVEVP